MKVRLRTPHRKGCPCQATWPENPWWIPGEREYLDTLGRKNGMGHMWLVVRCNIDSCPAEAVVSADSILRAVQQEIDGGRA